MWTGGWPPSPTLAPAAAPSPAAAHTPVRRLGFVLEHTGWRRIGLLESHLDKPVFVVCLYRVEHGQQHLHRLFTPVPSRSVHLRPPPAGSSDSHSAGGPAHQAAWIGMCIRPALQRCSWWWPVGGSVGAFTPETVPSTMSRPSTPHGGVVSSSVMFRSVSSGVFMRDPKLRHNFPEVGFVTPARPRRVKRPETDPCTRWTRCYSESHISPYRRRSNELAWLNCMHVRDQPAHRCLVRG
jgi:hypothetical protein